MHYTFTNDDIEKISGILQTEVQNNDNNWTWRVNNPVTKQSFVISINNNVALSDNVAISVISIQTKQGYYELHDCIAYLVFESDEIIFVQASDKYVSCLVISKQGTCSMYSNISRDILKADFNKLDPAILMSAMQLSLTESVLS